MTTSTDVLVLDLDDAVTAVANRLREHESTTAEAVDYVLSSYRLTSEAVDTLVRRALAIAVGNEWSDERRQLRRPNLTVRALRPRYQNESPPPKLVSRPAPLSADIFKVAMHPGDRGIVRPLIKFVASDFHAMHARGEQQETVGRAYKHFAQQALDAMREARTDRFADLTPKVLNGLAEEYGRLGLGQDD